VPIQADYSDLRANGCESGSLRLQAVDQERNVITGVPVAFVELAAEPPEQAAGLGQADVVRASMEGMTRTMEAMQRAQVERERAMAQKERAMADTQMAMNRMHSDLMIALVERLGGGKPQTPTAVLKEQLEFQKTLERNALRNAGHFPEPDAKQKKPEEEGGFLKQLLTPIAPALMMGLQETLVDWFAPDNALKAAVIRRGCSAYMNKLTGGPLDLGGASPSAEGDSGERLPRGRAMRELLARLDDAEADAFDTMLDTLTAEQYEQAEREAERRATLDDRVAWAREMLRASAQAAASVQNMTGGIGSFAGAGAGAGAGIDLHEIPPSLVAVLAQLSRDELDLCRQLIRSLDVETTRKLAAQLAALAPSDALARVRQMLDEARRKSASVAQRAVAFAMNMNGGGSQGGES
jgi:hypothetical protein